MQRLFQSPQGFSAMRRLHQDQARRIETQAADAMAVKPAVFAKPIGRRDEDERLSPRQAGKKRHHKAEGGGRGACSGYDLM